MARSLELVRADVAGETLEQEPPQNVAADDGRVATTGEAAAWKREPDAARHRQRLT